MPPEHVIRLSRKQVIENKYTLFKIRPEIDSMTALKPLREIC